MNKNENFEMSFYEKAMDKIVESDKKLIHLIGDYGIGKSYLLKSIEIKGGNTKDKENNVEKKIKILNFDDFIFSKEQIDDLDVMKKIKNLFTEKKKNKNYKNFQEQYNKSISQKKHIKFAEKLLMVPPTLTTITASIENIVGIKTLPLGLFLPIAIYGSIFKWLQRKKYFKKRENEIWIFHNIDRFKGDVIMELFKGAYFNKYKKEKIIFAYSTINLENRYKEKFGFFPKNIEILIEKFIDECVDLNLYKDDVAKKILNSQFKKRGLEDTLNKKISKIDNLNFRIVDLSAKFIKENEEIIKLIKLNPNICFLLKYLSFVDKRSYYGMKRNIAKLENPYYKGSSINKNHVESNEKKRNIDTIKSGIGEDLQKPKNTGELIKIIIEEFYYVDSYKFLSTDLGNYFINEETEKIQSIIKRKDIIKLINSSGSPEAIKKKYLIEWLEEANDEGKFEIIKKIIEGRENKHIKLLGKNIPNIFKKIDLKQKANLIYEIWLGMIKTSQIVSDNSANYINFSNKKVITPYIAEFLKNKNYKLDEENKKIFKGLIGIYGKSIKNFEDVFVFNEQFKTYLEIAILLKIKGKNVEVDLEKFVTVLESIPLMLIFKDKKEILKSGIKTLSNIGLTNTKIDQKDITSEEGEKYQKKSEEILKEVKQKFIEGKEYINKK